MNIAFRDTVPALSVYFKRSSNGKMESYTKPTVTSPFIFKEPPIISYNKGKFLKDMLVREKLLKVYTRIHTSTDVQPVNPCILSLCLFGFAMSFLVLP